ncbi:ATP-binding protein [Serinibacter arcticus]|uniref:ATP-binding protein n=1 Tax=Serinibacter arcticus TaxID=1655435 RepID=A0A2U1ZRF3_9MICO|nr:AAA family ATPase [Serinibacter arcticus]PWD49575.1 ATP-binding protein [Serinibacter arcticus]
MITTVAVAGYRSLREVTVGLGRTTVVTGPNGAGKSSLYRSLRLLASAARGELIADVARSGGLDALRWAGPENPGGLTGRVVSSVHGTVRTGPVRLLLGVASEDFGYAVDLGLPTFSEAGRFPHDSSIKAEAVFAGPFLRPASTLVDRAGPRMRQRGSRGWEVLPDGVATSRSILTEVADGRLAPEVMAVRSMLDGWRFYDQMRTDADAPARATHLATRSPVLSPDGASLASTLATIEEVGRRDVLAAAVDDALDGSRVAVHDVVLAGTESGTGGLEVVLHQPGLLRPVRAAEMSDGTVRFLLLAAALLSPRPPGLLVLNEPETSLHPRLLEPLARLVSDAARDSQIVMVTHSDVLADALVREGADRVHLVKDAGQTVVEGQGVLDAPPWHWPSR